MSHLEQDQLSSGLDSPRLGSSHTKRDTFDVANQGQSTVEGNIGESELLATRSVASKTNDSISSSTLSRKRAKAEAARAKAEFAKKEAELRKLHAAIQEKEHLSLAQSTRQKKDLEADLSLLKVEEEAAIAIAEVNVLESDRQSSRTRSLLKLPVDTPSVRTQEYVRTHAQIDNQDNPAERTVLDTFTTVDPVRKNLTQTPNFPGNSNDLRQNQAYTSTPVCYTDFAFPGNRHQSDHPSNQPINLPHFQSDDQQQMPQNSRSSEEFTRFLLKKDLLHSRLTKFTDKPELYTIWKSSFLGVMRDLNVSPEEEIDLLIKWLGPESTEQAVSLRAANVHNPQRGLFRIWERLDERYGCPEMVEASLKNKLASFPKLSNRDTKKLYELSDILSEIECAKEDPMYATLLSYFDSSSGIRPIVQKLPYNLQEKWVSQALNFKRQFKVPFPPFTYFVDFVRDVARAKNDPSLTLENPLPAQRTDKSTVRSFVSNRKTEVSKQMNANSSSCCPLHQTNHPLSQCRGFRAKTLKERHDLLKEFGLCFRCCDSSEHWLKACKKSIKCEECGSQEHVSAMHVASSNTNAHTPASKHGGERSDHNSSLINTRCTQICGKGFSGKSCAKTVLVKVYPDSNPDQAKAMYAIIDDQSNVSLASPQFFDLLNVNGEEHPYTLTSCAGSVQTSGRRASGYNIEAMDGSMSHKLPTLIECDHIPNNRHEIPTPDVAEHHNHLKKIANLIPPLKDDAPILLLIGRDIPEIHHIHEQIIGPARSPYAQKLSLGWVIVGECCLGSVHKPTKEVYVNKTFVLHNGRSSMFEPCPNKLELKDDVYLRQAKSNLGENVFQKRPDDNKPGLSQDDREFLNIMDNEMFRSSDGNWVAPLPFRPLRPRLPNNRGEALKRAFSLDKGMRKSPEKMQHFQSFMQDILDRGHAEIAPALAKDEECWYLPLFGVYHPQKPHQIRGVFDSSAQFNGVSLNNVLLSGPEMTNNLLGILLRFRKDQVAMTADIQQMFYGFYVCEQHRNFLRFFWYQDNDISKDLIEYRMCVHVFGNTSSPAVATYGLRKTAEAGERVFGADMKAFVSNDFYVDDGVTSLPTKELALDLMSRTKQALKIEGNLRLHKIASNELEVMNGFPADDLARELKDLDLGSSKLPTQRSLGLTWDLESDEFTFKVNSQGRPFTRRGVLSTVNSLYDPLGFVAPVVIEGKLLLRELISQTKDWDEPLPVERQKDWEVWRDSLQELEKLRVKRQYIGISLSNSVSTKVHVFSDASEQAIAAVSYLITTDSDGFSDVGFIMGKGKLAPCHGHTVPRLELCAAVLAVEMAETISDQLNITPEKIHFHTDSRVVLGYISNSSKRFYKYVANRVERITGFSRPEQWTYVSTESNPADSATRSLPATRMKDSAWLTGPLSVNENQEVPSNGYPLMAPETDKEIRHVAPLKTSVATLLGSHRFVRFSSWQVLVKTIAHLKHFARSCQQNTCSSKAQINVEATSVQLYTEAELHVIKEVQREVFEQEIECLQQDKPLPRSSSILKLNPFLDENGMIRVGGRINRGDFSSVIKHPLVVPGRHHIALLLVRHHHNQVRHQGRHLTAGAVRSAGLWITGAKRLISKLIHSCVKCLKLRGGVESQRMADLPKDRLTVAPAFTYVGLDVFGPWPVVTRKTRGGQANSKRWVVIFTCLTTRAVHLEIIEEMSSSSFINALRRFIAIRGKVSQFRSDRGTNFVGAVNELKINAVNVEDSPVKDFLFENGVTWLFNSPHSSHMGGAWERLIRTTRQILNSMMMDVPSRNLTHEVLCTFVAEVSAIMNSRPIVPVSTDADYPEILSPSMLLTQKTDQVTAPQEEWNQRDLYRSQWKCVQAMADQFWRRWRGEYLQTLQCRRKWTERKRNVGKGDVILLKDKEVPRNDWRLGIVVNTFPGDDNLVRKAEVKVFRKGKSVCYTRPISEMVVLVPSE